MTDVYHVPVLLNEVLQYLDPKPGKVIADLTLGGGGHSQAILKCLEGTGLLVGLDQDEQALREAGLKLAGSGNFRPLRGNFSQLGALFDEAGIDKIDGALMDLGVSSHQLDEADRGFSFRFDAKLDMRMDSRQEKSAADLLAECSQEELVEILFTYGEEKFARRIAKQVMAAREIKPIETTSELAELIKRAVPGQYSHGKIHPATKTFQALRIAVNDELSVLKTGLEQALMRLNPKGRLVVISYHSLEDRIVKNFFRTCQGVCTCPPRIPRCVCRPLRLAEIITRHPVVPGDSELVINPRSRSAKLRAVERV